MGTPLIAGHSKDWFSLSNEGWKRMNAGRSAAELIREAVSNTFDADGVTHIKVLLQEGYATIEDDAPNGIADPSLITTVFLTDKADSPTKRGRKGRGIKELISAADKAVIQTVGHQVIFDENGRQVCSSTRTRGTLVQVHVSRWTKEEIDQARLYLSKIISPDGVRFTINGVDVRQRKTRYNYPAHLKTHIIVDGVQKECYSNTNISVVNLGKGETEGWLYEMGIPIQKIKTKFHINVHQRVPLNDNRDTVDVYYINSIYALVLENMIDSLSLGALKQEWAQLGLSYTYSADVKKKIIKKMYGDTSKLVVKTKNTNANDVAKQHGFKLLDISAMPSSMEEAVLANIPNSDSVAKLVDESTKDEPVDPKTVDSNGMIAATMKYLGRHLLKAEVSTEFFKRGADYTGNLKLAHFSTHTKTIGFNVSAGLPLNSPLDPKMLSLVVHEFSHNVYQEHDDSFYDEVQNLAGRLASLILTHGNELKEVVGMAVAHKKEKKLTITCIDCGALREIFLQDAHQVTRCVTCAKQARRRRAKERRNMEST